MNKAAMNSLKDRGAFLRDVGHAVRQKLPRSLFAFLALVLAGHLLSGAQLSRTALASSAMSGREAAFAPPTFEENYAHGRALRSQTPDSGGNLMFAEAAGPFKLSNSALRIPLKPARSGATEKGLLASRLDTLKRGKSIYLVIRNLHAEVQPGVLYNLYLDLPVDATPGRNDSHFIGSINFFNSGYGGSASNPDFFFSYDITSVARKLRARKLLQERTTLTVYPATAPDAASAPTIGRVELFEQ